jgi:hypothetical protein
MSTKIFTIVFVLCMLSVFNCGRLQGSASDFDKVANGIEAKLAAFKQEFENKFAQKNLTENQKKKKCSNPLEKNSWKWLKMQKNPGIHSKVNLKKPTTLLETT